MLTFLFLLLLGAVTPLRFSPLFPHTIAIIPFISFAILFYFASKNTVKKTFIGSFLFGIGYFTSGVYWIFNSLHIYGEASVFLSALLTFLAILGLTFFIATPLTLVNLLCKKTSAFKKSLTLYPASMVLFEWLRCHIPFTGFPWLLAGYSQTTSWLNGIAAIIGVFGLSLVVYSISGCLAALTQPMNTKRNYLFSITAISLAALTIYSYNKDYTYLDNRSNKVYLVQGNIKQSLKYKPGSFETSMLQYINDTFQILHASKRNLIIWPEGAISTAFNLFTQKNNLAFPLIQQQITILEKRLKKQDSSLLSGTFYSDPKSKKRYNAIALINGSQNYQYYLKQKLVPFGEYYPLPFLSKPITKALKIAWSNLSPGDDNQQALKVFTDDKNPSDSYKISPFICYDAAYSNMVRNDTKGKQVIVIVSDDAWFGRSSALKQQLQIAQMRAIETGRYVLVDNNTGITAIINSKGNLISQAPIYKHFILNGTFRTAHNETPYMKWGYDANWAIILLLLLVGIIPSKPKNLIA
jgi:apolipoprotein N-acyltransferase